MDDNPETWISCGQSLESWTFFEIAPPGEFELPLGISRRSPGGTNVSRVFQRHFYVALFWIRLAETEDSTETRPSLPGTGVKGKFAHRN